MAIKTQQIIYSILFDFTLEIERMDNNIIFHIKYEEIMKKKKKRWGKEILVELNIEIII